jgi:hypothetical protein
MCGVCPAPFSLDDGTRACTRCYFSVHPHHPVYRSPDHSEKKKVTSAVLRRARDEVRRLEAATDPTLRLCDALARAMRRAGARDHEIRDAIAREVASCPLGELEDARGRVRELGHEARERDDEGARAVPPSPRHGLLKHVLAAPVGDEDRALTMIRTAHRAGNMSTVLLLTMRLVASRADDYESKVKALEEAYEGTIAPLLAQSASAVSPPRVQIVT